MFYRWGLGGVGEWVCYLGRDDLLWVNWVWGIWFEERWVGSTKYWAEVGHSNPFPPSHSIDNQFSLAARLLSLSFDNRSVNPAKLVVRVMTLLYNGLFADLLILQPPTDIEIPQI